MLDFLKGSDDPDYDQLVFLKAQIAFWLLAAIDGHAKNFSVALHPLSGFSLTPLYDVMSAQHIYDLKQIRRKDMKLAMSVGSNNHYNLLGILPRHYEQTVHDAGLPQFMLETAISQVSSKLPAALDVAVAELPEDFPAELRDSIAEGALDRLESLR